MTFTLTIPDKIASSWCASPEGLPTQLLQDAAVEAYRQGKLSLAEVGTLLGHSSRWEAEDFLAAHNAWPDPTESETVAGAKAMKQTRAR